MQIPTFKSHPRCSCHVICPEWLAKHNQNCNFSALLVSSLLYFSQLYSIQPIPNFYSTATSTCTPAPLLLSSALLFSNLLCSTLLSSILYSTIFRSLPLLHLYAGADWTQWSLGQWECNFLISWGTCQLDTMLSVLMRMQLLDLLRHMPTGHNDRWASENVTSWSLGAHANWTQCSLC